MASASASLRRLGQGLSVLSFASASTYLASQRGGSSSAYSQESASGTFKRPLASVVYEQEYCVPSSCAASLCAWVQARCSSALKHPGFLGAKLAKAEDPSASRPLVLFVLGGPGAGKGTQCERIVQEYGYEHLSAGDLLRAARRSGSSEGQLIDEYIKEGKIVPVEITVSLLKKAMEESGKRRFLIDGFPRNGNNLAGWQQQMSSVAHVGGVLMFECPEEVMEARLLERGKSSGRADDNAESIKKRFHTYRAETMPVVQFFAQLGLVHTVDGTQPVDVVFETVQAALKQVHANDAQRRGLTRVVVQLYAQDRPSLHRWLETQAKADMADLRNFMPEAASSASCRTLETEGSMKPYGLESARSFD